MLPAKSPADPTKLPSAAKYRRYTASPSATIKPVRSPPPGPVAANPRPPAAHMLERARAQKACPATLLT